jgi:hypothetical protein
MNDPPTRDLVSLLLGLSGLMVPALLIFVLSRAAGWPALADRYPAPDRRPRPLVRMGYGVFRGWIGYNGGLVVSGDERGLYLSAMPLVLSWCHAPIFIPWAEIREIRPRKRLWARLLEIHTVGAPEVDMAIHSGTFAPVRPFAVAAKVPGAY